MTTTSPSFRPETGKPALLLIDLVNPFDFPEGELLAAATEERLPVVQGLAARCRAQGGPVVYVNDNFGRWQSDFRTIFSWVERGRGGDIARALRPHDEDYFVLKPHRSGFYASPLDLLLRELRVCEVVLAGVATDMCVLATANDARTLGYQPTVADDGAASLTEERHRRALRVIEEGMQIAVRPASSCFS